MSKKEKLLKKLKLRPKDFTYNELETLLLNFNFKKENKGKTSGSRIEFIHKDNGIKLLIHKPHPSNIIKRYIIDEVLNIIEKLED